MHSLPVLHDFGRPRMVDGARLEPFAEAFRAYVLWRSIPRQNEPAIAIAQRDADGVWRWCGGFAGLPAVLSGRIQIRPLSRRVSAEHIRAAMWAEAVSGLTVRNRDAAIWKAQIERGLPDDLLKTFFGPRGVTPSSAAAHFGTTRQTLALHLRDTHG